MSVTNKLFLLRLYAFKYSDRKVTSDKENFKHRKEHILLETRFVVNIAICINHPSSNYSIQFPLYSSSSNLKKQTL